MSIRSPASPGKVRALIQHLEINSDSPEKVDWTDQNARCREIKRLRLDHLPSQPGLPSEYRAWRSMDKFCYTLLLTMVREPDELAEAFGLQKAGEKDILSSSEELFKEITEGAKQAAFALKGFQQAYRFPSWRRKLMDKWRALGRHARREILLTAWPDIAPRHRMDIYDAPLLEDPEKGLFLKESATKPRSAAYLTPQINLEDLTQGNNMILFLQQRATHEPGELVDGDLERARIERLGNGVPFSHLIKGSINLETPQGDASQSHYGDIDRSVDLDEFINSDQVWGRALTVNDGILVIKIQERIAYGIDSFIHVMNEDLTTASETASEQVRNLDDHVDTEAASLTSLLAIHQQYKSPHDPLPAILNMCARMAREFRRRLWQLRRDPQHFVSWALEYFAHAPENALDSNGEKHPDLSYPDKHLEVYDRTTSALMADTYLRCIQWDILVNLIQEVIDTGYSASDHTKWAREKQESLILCLLKLHKFLHVFMLRRLAGNITRSAAALPELAQYYTRQIGTRFSISIKPDVGDITSSHHDRQDGESRSESESVLSEADAMSQSVYLLELVSQAFTPSPSGSSAPALVPLDDALVELARLSGLNQLPGASKLLQTEIKEAGRAGLIVNQLRVSFPLVFSSVHGTGGAALDLLPEVKKEMARWLSETKRLVNELDRVMRFHIRPRSPVGFDNDDYDDDADKVTRPRLAVLTRAVEECLKAGEGMREASGDRLAEVWAAFSAYAQGPRSREVEESMAKVLKAAAEEAEGEEGEEQMVEEGVVEGSQAGEEGMQKQEEEEEE